MASTLRYPIGMTQDSPSRRQDQFVLRLPDGMRDRIAEAAKRAGRSMNAEIVQTLIEKYPQVLTEDALQALRIFYRDPTAENFRDFSRTTNYLSLEEMVILEEYGFDIGMDTGQGSLTVSISYNPAKPRRPI